MAYRKQINGILEVCFYVNDPCLRLQSVGSGFTHSIIGIENEYHLKVVLAFDDWSGFSMTDNTKIKCSEGRAELIGCCAPLQRGMRAARMAGFFIQNNKWIK